MFNAATKTAFTAGAFAAIAGFAAVFSTSDRVAFSVLVFTGVLAVTIGLAGFYFAPRDPVVPVSAEVESAAVRSTDLTDLPRPSPWPLLGALSVTMLAIGAAIGKSLIVLGLIVAVVAAFAWLGQVWREHPSWTEAMTARLNDRFVVPIGLPGTVIVLVGIGAVSLSRIFLAVSKTAAPIIGSVIAFALLGVFYLLSTRDEIDRKVIRALAAGSAVLVLGSGVVGALVGEREFHHPHAEHASNVVEVVVGPDGFDRRELDLPANSEVIFAFTNNDTVEHTFSIYEDEEAQTPILAGDPVAPGQTVEIEFMTPDAGIYYFQSDTDPEAMHGVLNVTVDASILQENPQSGVDEPTPTTAGH